MKPRLVILVWKWLPTIEVKKVRLFDMMKKEKGELLYHNSRSKYRGSDYPTSSVFRSWLFSIIKMVGN